MKYIPALDGIRAFAVLLVIVFHTHVPFINGGYRGVDIFFVLSGFIITTLLLGEIKEKGRVNFLYFYLRRILRLYPALLLMLVLVLAGLWAGAVPIGHYYRYAAIAAAYMSDFAILWGFMPATAIIMHTWSLAIEEHYYIIWPALLQLLKKAAKEKLALYVGALYVLAFAWKLAGCALFDFNTVYLRFDLHVSGLLLGGWLAAYRSGGGKIPEHRILLGMAFALFCFCMLGEPPQTAWDYCLGIFITEIFTMLLIYEVVENGAGGLAKILGGAVPAYLGRISYGQYLFHYPIAAYLRIHHGWTTVFPVTLGLTIALASLSYFIVERPALAVAKKYRAA